ncbi:AmmeMemoRadiSam system radical SAM enzyme [Anoxybacter fermentans]|uniref:AmmeMemoRadiSam system radical SAM enzyme n=1 Tax=Anoxybacter fermentans TaxID=1323375 RepID=A0A3S9SUF6_9FIRM|nr:AmmeMemoRadiSam system radical SAM enzyme [Anoxybacter fermentans]AZR71937.1 AmmeMemoRadiSam system radical SAM enzyme [Anoxybacter fermentans]
MKALYYEKLEDDCVKCQLCPRECILKPDQRGYCRARENRDGELYSTIYAQISAIALDPIEKKPLYHFYPGSEILSVGTVGCNLSCMFCQNWHIAHDKAPTRKVTGKELVELALRYNSIGIAYTYSEPLIWYEYILETSKLAREAGLKNVLVTNGFINEEPLKELLQYIDGINLDVKAFHRKFYKEICGGGDLEVIKKTAVLTVENCHLEVTTLLVPGLNDDPEEIEKLSKWLASLSPDIPFHLSRYFPQYKMDLPPTDVESMLEAKKVAEKYLNYVYLGNLTNADRNTYCYQCHYPVVKRSWQVDVDLKDGHCPRCGVNIPIIL